MTDQIKHHEFLTNYRALARQGKFEDAQKLADEYFKKEKENK